MSERYEDFGKQPDIIKIPEGNFMHTVYDSQFGGKLNREIAVSELPVPVIINGFVRFALLDLQLQELPKGRLVLMSPSSNIYPYTCLDPVFTPRDPMEMGGLTMLGDRPTHIALGPAVRNQIDRYAGIHDTTIEDLVTRAISFGLDYAPKEREGYRAGFFSAGGNFHTHPLYDVPDL